jgi:hypothetical protein
MFAAHIRSHLSLAAELICFCLSAHVASHHPRFASSAHALSGRCAQLSLGAGFGSVIAAVRSCRESLQGEVGVIFELPDQKLEIF